MSSAPLLRSRLLPRSLLVSLLLVFPIAASAQVSSGAPPDTRAETPADFDTTAVQAAAAREAGNRDQALTAYRRAVQIKPTWAEGWWYLGTLQYEGDQYSPAISSFEKLLQLTPENGIARALLGLCQFEIKEYSGARANLERAEALSLTEDPEIRRVAMYHLALLLNRSGEFQHATKTIATAFGDNPYPEQAKVALAMALLRIPLFPEEVDPSHDALLHAAGEIATLLAQGKSPAALNAFPALIKSYPATPYLHFAYSKALASAGRSKEAFAELQSEKDIFSNEPLPVEGGQPEARIATLYAHNLITGAAPAISSPDEFDSASRAAAQAEASGKVADAMRNYQRALQQRPDWAAGLWKLGMLSYSSANYQEAISALISYVALVPSDGTAWAVLGLSEYNEKDYDNALIHLRRGQHLEFGGTPESIQNAQYHLGILLNRAGRFEDATAVLAPATKAGPLASEASFALGMAQLRMAMLPAQVPPSLKSLVTSSGQIAELLQAGRYEPAFARFQELLSQFPDVPFLHYAYGTALASLSQYDEAAEQMRQELNISPASVWPNVRLAWIALHERRASEAIEPAKRAVQLAPDSAQAHYLLGRAYFEAGQLDPAIAELELAVKMAPSSAEVHFTLGKAYAKARQPEKADAERAEFDRLNAMLQEGTSAATSQAYQGPHDAGSISGPN